MKLSKTIGRVAATFLATAMLASMSAVSVLAQDEPYTYQTGNTITITKHLTKEANTMVPNVSFSFTVTPATIDENGETRNGLPVTAGVSNSVTVDSTDNAAVFTPGDSLNTATDVTDTVKFNVNVNSFNQPGIYKYTVTENTFTYDGITTDNNVLNLYVYIENNDSEEVGAPAFKVAYTELVDPDASTVDGKPQEAKTDSFTNDYDKNGSTLHDLTLYKTISGNAAYMSGEFSFAVTISGEKGEKYYVEIGTYNNGSFIKGTEATGTTAILTSGTSGTFTLGQNDAIKIYGLDSNDSYTIKETISDRYSVKIDDTDDNDGEATGTISNDKTIHYENIRNTVTPTGIVMDIAPYILLVVAAAAGCFVFLRKRRED